MKRTLATLFVLTSMLGGAGVAAAAAPDGAQAGEMTLDPTSGPPGTTFTVTSVTDCQTKGPTAVDLTAPGTTDPEQTVTPNAQGEWTAEFTVADGTAAGTDIPVDATCRTDFESEDEEAAGSTNFAAARGRSDFTLVIYETEIFEVTAAPTDTTATPTTAPPTTPTTEPPATLPTTDAAPAVVAQPTLTG